MKNKAEPPETIRTYNKSVCYGIVCAYVQEYLLYIHTTIQQLLLYQHACALCTLWDMTVPRQCFFYRSFLLFMFRVCHAFLSVLCSLVVTCLERVCTLALLCVMFSCVVVTFPCDVLGQVWYLIVSISDLCLLSYFVVKHWNITQRCIKET